MEVSISERSFVIMKLIPVDAIPKVSGYHKLQDLIEEFVNGDANGFLHPGWRITFGEILPQSIRSKCHTIQIAFLFLTHNSPHHINRKMPLLTELLEPLGLGKRRGSLFTVHRVQ